MKKIVSIITALTVFAGSTFADEGMWLLPLLEKMNGKAMKEMGCRKLRPVWLTHMSEFLWQER